MKTMEITKERLMHAICNQYHALSHQNQQSRNWTTSPDQLKKRLENLTLEQLITDEVHLENNPEFGPTTIEGFIGWWHD